MKAQRVMILMLMRDMRVLRADDAHRAGPGARQGHGAVVVTVDVGVGVIVVVVSMIHRVVVSKPRTMKGSGGIRGIRIVCIGVHVMTVENVVVVVSLGRDDERREKRTQRGRGGRGGGGRGG